MFVGEVDLGKIAYRPRESPYPLVSVDEAVNMVIQRADVLGTEEVFFRSK